MPSNGATAIWSGYNHQGKVGLFAALREVNRLIQSNDDTTGWKLVFELGEDFQISRQSNGQPLEIISRHQVKAWDSTSFSKYEGVFTRHQKLDSKREPIFDEGNPVMVDGFNAKDVPINGRFIHVIKPLDITNWKNDYAIQLYEYPPIDKNAAKPYCDLSKATDDEDELMRFAVAEIRLATDKDESEASLIWKELQHLLQVKIGAAHYSKTFAEFTFDDLILAITQPKGIKSYDSDKRRRSILEYGEDFIGQNESLPTFTDERRRRVVRYIQDLTSLNDDLILASLRYLHINDRQLLDINSTGMKQVVYNVMSQIVNYAYESNCIQFEKDGSSYMLTVITEMEQGNDGANMHLAGKVADSLAKEDAALIFRRAKIINKSLDADFSDVLGEERLESYIAQRLVYNITDPAPLEFISIDKAVTELNNENL